MRFKKIAKNLFIQFNMYLSIKIIRLNLNFSRRNLERNFVLHALVEILLQMIFNIVKRFGVITLYSCRKRCCKFCNDRSMLDKFLSLWSYKKSIGDKSSERDGHSVIPLLSSLFWYVYLVGKLCFWPRIFDYPFLFATKGTSHPI